MFLELVVAEITTHDKEIFPSVKITFSTCACLLFWALPYPGGGMVPFSDRAGVFPLISQDRLDWGVKLEKWAPTFHAILNFWSKSHDAWMLKLQGDLSMLPSVCIDQPEFHASMLLGSLVAHLQQMHLHPEEMRLQVGINWERKNWKPLFEGVCKPQH